MWIVIMYSGDVYGTFNVSRSIALTSDDTYV